VGGTKNHATGHFVRQGKTATKHAQSELELGRNDKIAGRGQNVRVSPHVPNYRARIPVMMVDYTALEQIKAFIEALVVCWE